MKVLHIIQRYPPSIGGSEQWCQSICRFLSQNGIYAEVLTLRVYDEEEYWRKPPFDRCVFKFGKLEYDGSVKVFRFAPIKLNPLLNLFFDTLYKNFNIHFYGPHSLSLYWNIFRKTRKTDVVHLHTLPFSHNFVGLLAAKIFKKPVVITPHFHPKHPHYENSLNYLILKRSNCVITVSKSEKDYLVSKGVDKSKILVLGNGVNLAGVKQYMSPEKDKIRFKYNIPEYSKVVTFIGRKMDFKGINYLIEAIKELQSQEKKVVVCLIGPSTFWFRDYFKTVSEEDKVFIRNIEDASDKEKNDILSITDVFVLPSKYEAFGIVLLEAWIHKIPVVGIKKTGSEEVIGDTGLCVDYGDVQQLKKSIKFLIENSNNARKMGEKGRLKVEKIYNWDVLGKKALSKYRDLVKSKLRILLVSNFFPPYFFGGAELVAYEQAKVLKSLDCEVSIFSGKIDNRKRQHATTKENRLFRVKRINLHQIDLIKGELPGEGEAVVEQFRKTLREYSPDLVHFHNLAGFPVRIIDECKKLNIPTIKTVHDFWMVCKKHTLLTDRGEICNNISSGCFNCKMDFSLTERNSYLTSAFRQIDRFLLPSKFLADFLIMRNISKEKMIVLNNGINYFRFKGAFESQKSNGCFRFGYIGYLAIHKGVEYLLDAFAEVLMNKKHIKLYLILSGYNIDYFKEIRNRCNKLGIAKYVRFYNRVPNEKMINFYKKIDVLVLPSIWPENHPVTINEAMASKVTVLASRIGGIPELIKDGENGLLFPPKDAKRLAESMKFCIDNPQATLRMRENAYTDIKKIDIQSQVKLILKEYHAILANRN